MLGRYLLGKPREVKVFKYKVSDFAGCRRTRKSTSAGVVLFGGHAVKSWSSTQAVIALSSGEAEYYGLVIP